MKKRPYREIIIREKARKLSKEAGITFEEALIVETKKRNESDLILKGIAGKSRSKTALRKERKLESKLREKSVKEFGFKLVPGLPSFQGGAPGGGKKR